jgi:hypothetical protein
VRCFLETFSGFQVACRPRLRQGLTLAMTAAKLAQSKPLSWLVGLEEVDLITALSLDSFHFHPIAFKTGSHHHSSLNPLALQSL